jgi:cobalt/nickel transport system permease protein
MAQFGLDQYAHLDSPIHRWEPRTKLIGLIGLVFAFSAVRDVRLLPAMYLVTALLFLLSRLPLRFLLLRLKLPGYFLLFLVAILPFITGETVLLRLGPLALRQEGLLEAGIIASRFLCIITVTLILFGTSPFLTSIKALRALGMPVILADMMLLTYRYLFEMAETLTTMRTAIRLRGFDGSRFSRRNLHTLAALIGSLLVRSYEQADQVYKAMILRGYGAEHGVSREFRTGAVDMALCGAAVAMAVIFMAAQYWLGQMVA